ncbi:MAG: methionyl-tRNA formyltransferase [Clostridia bacterium]|nr:methionyl-tRNA formyltransferase [Clostridia bacterium]
MRIMFMGTPDFAVSSLIALKEAGHEIVAVVTMPDKPKGRGHKMTHTPVYEAAVTMDTEIYTPENIKEDYFGDVLKKINPDIIVVVAYGKILPEYILNYPKYGCVNVHASLLPKYRGAAPIQRSIIEGETVTGVTTMYMEKGLDTGDMLLKSEVEITDEDNYKTVHDKLAQVGAELIVKTLSALQSGIYNPEKQDDSMACYAHMITKETATIDWTKSARDIHNLIRGLFPIPKAFTTYSGKIMKIGTSSVSSKTSSVNPGTIIEVTKDSFFVSCGDNSVLEILSIQIEGKKMMKVSEFLIGNDILVNSCLGE